MSTSSILAYKNCIDFSILSGGNWLNTNSIKLDNLKDVQPEIVARSAGLEYSDTIIVISLDKRRSIDVFNIVNHNFSDQASIRIKFYDDDTSITPVYDTEIVEYLPLAPWGSIPYLNEFWWSGHIGVDPDIKNDTISNMIGILNAPVICKKIVLEIFDNSNPYGYIELGRLQFMQALYLSNNELEYGATIGLDDNTFAQKSDSGATYFTRRTGYRTVSFALSGLNETDGHLLLYNFEKYVGHDKEVIFVWNINDTHNMKAARSFAGFIRSATKAESIGYNLIGKSYVIEERI